MNNPAFLSAVGVVCALGSGDKQVLSNLLSGSTAGMVEDNRFMGEPHTLGMVQTALPKIRDNNLQNSRTNQLLMAACQQIKHEVEDLKRQLGSDRIGVVIGTSTSGTLEAEAAIHALYSEKHFPENFDYRIQEMGDSARFVADLFELTGPFYSVSTACSSSGKVFGSARNLIQSGLCDAVIVGGADSLCRMTVQGFSALELVSKTLCAPLAAERNGINLGEGASVFIATKKRSKIALLGVGESSDAWHVSAPHGEGRGAKSAMLAALADAGLVAGDIHYVNLHGTATAMNDVVECKATFAALGNNVPCSSTKNITGHTLGAAGAVEAALCWLLLSSVNVEKKMPPAWVGQFDPELSKIRLTTSGDKLPSGSAFIMSNSL